MDQATSEGRPTVSAASEESRQKSPEEIRTEIEETREPLGDAVEALAEKADAQQVASTVSRQPVPFAAAGAFTAGVFAAGVLVGRLLGGR